MAMIIPRMAVPSRLLFYSRSHTIGALQLQWKSTARGTTAGAKNSETGDAIAISGL
jgi:hypothetical protein